MPVTALLVRWADGWLDVEDAAAAAIYGRNEAFLSLGAVQSAAEARRVATRELTATFAHVREQTSVEHRPASTGETPYTGYRPGDRITVPGFDGTPALRAVTAITVRLDDTGIATYLPEVGDDLLGLELVEARISRTLRKMAPGSGSAVSTPAR